MHRFLILCGFGLGLVIVGAANAQTIDKNGRCHDAAGKFAKAEVCQNVAKPATSCRDKTTKKFAKCDSPNSEPMPKAAAPK